MRVSTFSLAVALSAASTVAVAAAPQPHGGPKATTHGNGSKSTGTTDSGATTTTTPTTAPPLNPIAQKISNNHGLLPKVTALLPKGMSLDQATIGYKNQGQALAALHAAHNLGIPYADLKTAMTGITPIVGPVPPAPTGTAPTTTPTSTTPRLSLGQAIQKLAPTSVHSTTEATTAEHQASRDLEDASTPPKPATKTTAPATTAEKR
jgi:hypothetical protein